MATQVRRVGGTLWITINVAPDGSIPGPPQEITDLNPAFFSAALRAANTWVNCGGSADAAERAQKTANAVGLELRET